MANSIKTIEEIAHEIGLLYHDVQTLHIRTRKLNKERRTAGKYAEIMEELSEIRLAAAACDSEMRQHPEYPTSYYIQDSFMSKIDEEARALKETLARVFSRIGADADNNDDDSNSAFDSVASEELVLQ